MSDYKVVYGEIANTCDVNQLSPPRKAELEIALGDPSATNCS